MSIVEINKSELIKQVQIHDSDTGSAPVQIAILTFDIQLLSNHLSSFKKDNSARRSLLLKISYRTKLLKYLHKYDYVAYKNLIQKLNIKDKL